MEERLGRGSDLLGQNFAPSACNQHGRRAARWFHAGDEGISVSEGW